MGNSCDDYDRALWRVLKQAGVQVPARPWHAFRHTFASHYVMSGGNLVALQRHLGHHSIQQTMAYAHVVPDFAAADLARLNFDAPPAAAEPAEVIPCPVPERRPTR